MEKTRGGKEKREESQCLKEEMKREKTVREERRKKGFKCSGNIFFSLIVIMPSITIHDASIYYCKMEKYCCELYDSNVRYQQEKKGRRQYENYVEPANFLAI